MCATCAARLKSKKVRASSRTHSYTCRHTRTHTYPVTRTPALTYTLSRWWGTQCCGIRGWWRYWICWSLTSGPL
jgi:hypothetical protein